MLWHRQAIFESKGDKLFSSAECRIRTQGLRHLFANRLNACWQTDWAIEDQAKTWTRQPVPMISKHSAHSTSLPVGFRTWLWRYTCLLLLISMLWHRQAIFESKGDKLSSSAECRIRTQGLRHPFTYIHTYTYTCKYTYTYTYTYIHMLAHEAQHLFKAHLRSPGVGSAEQIPKSSYCNWTAVRYTMTLHMSDPKKTRHS